jgi:hypothetical protein
MCHLTRRVEGEARQPPTSSAFYHSTGDLSEPENGNIARRISIYHVNILLRKKNYIHIMYNVSTRAKLELQTLKNARRVKNVFFLNLMTIS